MTTKNKGQQQGVAPATGGQVTVQTGDPERFGEGVRESFEEGQPPAQQGEQPPPPPPPPPAGEQGGQQPRTFTAEEIEEARRQEKDKLYPRIQSLDEQLKEMRAAQEAREKAEQEERERIEREAAEAERQREAEELSAKELLEKREREWNEKFSSFEQQLALRDAALAKEREFNELMSYRSDVMRDNAEDIIPELLDMVAGSTREEIDQSVAALKQRSASILANVSQAAGDMRSQMQGASITAPPVGPSDTNSDHRTFSADDIAGMTMDEYAKYRSQLLQSANQRVSERGLYE